MINSTVNAMLYGRKDDGQPFTVQEIVEAVKEDRMEYEEMKSFYKEPSEVGDDVIENDNGHDSDKDSEKTLILGEECQ